MSTGRPNGSVLFNPDNTLADVKAINPFASDNTPETQALLYKLFRAEELKDKRTAPDQKEQKEEKEKPKIKVWDKDTVHTIDGQKFYLTTQVNRRKKTYARLVVLDWNAPFPTDRIERGEIYLKQNPETGEVLICSDNNGTLKRFSRVEWGNALQKRYRHLYNKQEESKQELHNRVWETGNPGVKQIRWLNDKKKEVEKFYGAERDKLENLFTSPKKQILDNLENHEVVSAILSMYGNEYIYEDFPATESIGKGATKRAKPSQHKFKLVPPPEGSPEGTPGSISDIGHHKKDKVALEMATGKFTGDELKTAADSEKETLSRYHFLAKQFNPKKLIVKRDKDGEILAVYMTVNKAPGVELAEYMNPKTRKYNFKNTDKSTEIRKQLTEMLLKAVEEYQKDGIIHKDLKPQNVIVDIDTKTGVVRSLTIIDYGFADKKGRTVGTPTFISPEMYADPKTVDKRTDDYSLGILLRDIWNDPMMTHRTQTINKLELRVKNRMPVRDTWEKEILSAEHDLHIPIRKAEVLDSHGLDDDYKDKLQQVLDGLSATHRDERMSVGQAKKILGIQLATIQEEKTAEVKASEAEIKADIEPENKISEDIRDAEYFEKCFLELQMINSDDALLYLLTESLDQLYDYADSLPEESDTQKFLINYYYEIESVKHAVPQAYLPDVIVFVSEILFKIKNRPENLNIQDADLDLKKEFINLKSILYSFDYYEKKAWNDTFLAHISRSMQKKLGFRYFFGWSENTKHEKFGVKLFGFILTPIKNIIKFCTEFPLKFIAEMVNYFRGKVERTQPSGLPGKGARFLMLGLLYSLTIVTTGAWLLMRTLTSPKTSLDEAGKAQQSFTKYLNEFEPKNYFTKALKYAGLAVCKLRLLEGLSMACTMAGTIGVTLLAAPVVAYAGAYYGISWMATVGTFPVFSQIAALMATPVTWLAAQVGIATTGAALATLTGASALTGATAILLAIRAAFVHVYEVHTLNRPPTQPKKHKKAAVAPAEQNNEDSNLQRSGATTSKLYRSGIQPRTVDLPPKVHKGSSEMKSGHVPAATAPAPAPAPATAPASTSASAHSRPRLNSTSRS